MKKRPRLLIDSLFLLILIAGFIIFMYPFVSQSLNRVIDQRLITYYQEKSLKENEQAFEKTKKEMLAVNAELASNGGTPGADPFSEDPATIEVEQKEDDFYEKHTIGILYIPSIQLSLPIFDGTEEAFLQNGAGLLEGTSYPTGGSDTHAVITGHRGLSNAKLFTDLPKLENGDQFYIEINGEKLAYEIFEQATIEPTDTSLLKIEPGKDLVTLMTCTPYMVNSHRLLITGKRVPYVEETAKKEIKKLNFWNKYGVVLWLAVILVVVTGGGYILLKKNKNKKHKEL